MQAGLAVVLSVLLLYCFYRAVEYQWPESYFPTSNALDRAITKGPFRYLAFRFLPLLLVCTGAGAVLARSHKAVALPVLAIAVIHSLATSGRAIYLDWHAGRLSARPLVFLFRATIALACVLVALASLLLAPLIRTVVPTGKEFAVALWTGALAGVLGAYIVALSGDTTDSTAGNTEAFIESRRVIGDDVWDRVGAIARSVDGDPVLVRAIMLVENIQRPPWVRRLEQVASRIVPRGSYGIFQIQTEGRARAPEEIEVSVAAVFAGQRIPTKTQNGYESQDDDWISLFLSNYNPDPQWQDDVRSAMGFQQYPYVPTVASSVESGPDERPLIEITRYILNSDNCSLRGTAFLDRHLRVVQLDALGAALSDVDVAIHASSHHRGEWTYNEPRSDGAISLRVESLGGDPDCSVLLPVTPVFGRN